MLKDKIRQSAERRRASVVEVRRHLHQYPELSFCEEKTSAFVQKHLRDLGIPFSTGWAEHGIVGIIEGNRPDSGVIALRADMDALPIQEENDVPYRSKHDGMMHACGHDVHTASLLGAAAILNELRADFDGTIKLIFQPGEEKLPGGASLMIRDGVLKDPVPRAILGQHVHPALPVGSVGFRSGMSMASADEITLTVHGKGGHGAMPHLTVDPVVVSAQIITGLQQIVSRGIDPILPAVLTFGKINSDGGAFNVIPDSVRIHGTFRTFDEQWRYKTHALITRTATGIAEAMGATCEVFIDKGYPALTNDVALTEKSMDAARAYLGMEKVEEIPPRLTAEDFSYYTQEIPGCFYRLGVANKERGITSPVHTPHFDIDEDALLVGSGLMAWLAIAHLSA